MPNQKLSRLLQLYPVEVLREAWGIKGMTKGEISDLLPEQASQDDIEGFCRVHQGRTKQRIILLGNDAGTLKPFADPLLGTKAPVFVKRTNQRLARLRLIPTRCSRARGERLQPIDGTGRGTFRIMSRQAAVSFDVSAGAGDERIRTGQ